MYNDANWIIERCIKAECKSHRVSRHTASKLKSHGVCWCEVKGAAGNGVCTKQRDKIEKKYRVACSSGNVVFIKRQMNLNAVQCQRHESHLKLITCHMCINQLRFKWNATAIRFRWQQNPIERHQWRSTSIKYVCQMAVERVGKLNVNSKMKIDTKIEICLGKKSQRRRKKGDVK